MKVLARAHDDLRRSRRKSRQANEKFEESQHFLNLLIENIPNMIFVKEARELRFIRFNKAGERLIGFDRAEMLGKNDYDFFPKEQADFFTQMDRDVLRGDAIVNIREEDISTRLQGRRQLRTKKLALFDKDGEAQYLLGISEDITELRAAERQQQQLAAEQVRRREAESAREALRSSEEYFRLVAETIPQMVWTADVTGHLDYMNTRWFEYTGSSGDTDPQVERYTAVHPHDRARCQAAWQESVRSGAPYDTEVRLQRNADRTYRWHLSRARPVRGPDGNIIRWFGTTTDIDDQRSSQDSVRLAQERLNLALESGKMGSWELSIEEGRLWRSDQYDRLFGFEASCPEITADFILSRIHPEDRERVSKLFHEESLAGEALSLEYRVVWPDGSVHWLLSNAKIFRNASGTVARVAGATVDITTQKEIELRLKSALQSRDEFLSIASHELKTPITSLKLQLQVAERTLDRGHEPAHARIA